MSRYLILYYRPGGAGPWRECPHCTRLLSNSRNLGKSECIYLVLTATSLIHSSRSHSLPRNMKLKVRDLAWPWRGQHHCTTRQLQLQPGQVINCPVSKFWVRSFITQSGHTHLGGPTFTTLLHVLCIYHEHRRQLSGFLGSTYVCTSAWHLPNQSSCF